MQKNTLFIKAAVLISAITALSFAGVEPSPFLPIWKIIIILIGG